MATARRLSDLLLEQQEPFLLLHLLQDDQDGDQDDTGTPTTASTRSLLRGSTANVTKLALRWADGVLAGCFSFPFSRAAITTARQRFRRHRRGGGDDDDDGGIIVNDAPSDRNEDHGAGDCCGGRQQLSPVSVLALQHSDDEPSPVPSHRDDEHSDDDNNGKPSTSDSETAGTTGTSSPSSNQHQHLPGSKIHATEAKGNDNRLQRTSTRPSSISSSLAEKELLHEAVAVVSAAAGEWEWESTGTRIPNLVELDDLSASPRDDWRRLVVVGGGGGEEDEARQVAMSIEAMVFEEVRWEAVSDMLSLVITTTQH